MYVSHYLQRDEVRKCFMQLDTHRVESIAELVAALRLTPRQIQEVFRILGHVLATSEKNEGRLLWCPGVGSIAMAAFKVGNPRVFELLGTQQFQPLEAVRFLTELLGVNNIDWWFKLFLTGGGLRVSEGLTAEQVMAEAGLIEKGETSGRLDLGAWRLGWGGSYHSRFAQIYQMIEQVGQWE